MDKRHRKCGRMGIRHLTEEWLTVHIQGKYLCVSLVDPFSVAPVADSSTAPVRLQEYRVSPLGAPAAGMVRRCRWGEPDDIPDHFQSQEHRGQETRILFVGVGYDEWYAQCQTLFSLLDAQPPSTVLVLVLDKASEVVAKYLDGHLSKEHHISLIVVTINSEDPRRVLTELEGRLASVPRT